MKLGATTFLVSLQVAEKITTDPHKKLGRDRDFEWLDHFNFSNPPSD
jgi:hypothetical protein